MKKFSVTYRFPGIAVGILVVVMCLAGGHRLAAQVQNAPGAEAVSVINAGDSYPPDQPVLQNYGPDLSDAETYKLDPLTSAERQFIESRVDPLCVGVVRDLPVPISFLVKDSDIPSTGSVTVSGGRLTRVDEGRVAWTIRVESAGADRLRLVFSEGNIPDGVEVNLHGRDNPSFRQASLQGVIGPYGFYTTTTFSDQLVLQFVIPVNVLGEMHFRISSVVHSEEEYINRAPLTCYEDANCAYANGYSDIEALQNAIALIYYVEAGGNYQCSGGLMNDVRATDNQPFFLTANHCFNTQASAATLEAYFDYETLSCGGVANPSTFLVNGSNLIAENSQTDFTLVLLHQQPGGARTYLGWSAASVPNNETMHSVHHPSAMLQKYSRVQNKTSPSYTCTGRSTSYFLYTTIVGGQAWHGSSGAPVVKENNVVTGQMLGPCGDDSDICDFSEYYLNWGRFDESYGNNNLQYWLYGGGASVSMSSSPSSSWNFGTVNVGSYGTLTVTVNNTGTVPNYLNLDAGSVSISGTNAGDFSIIGSTSLYLPPATSGTFTIRFQPGSPGMKTATLTIPHNADNIISPRLISLTGYGNPCSDVISLGGGGLANTKTFDVTGTGAWFTSTDNACGVTSEGVEQVYSFVAPVSGTYKIQVTSTNGTNVCYMWRSGSCITTGWNCIGTVSSAGTYGSLNWTAGTTYYLLLDDQYTSATTHTFYLYYEPCDNITSITWYGSLYSQTYPGGGNGIWHNGTPSSCGYYCFGREQVYQFTAPVTGLYNMVVTAASGYVDYFYNTSCNETGWTCIDDIASPGTYGSLLLTEGVTYYFLLDDENTTAGTHTFYLGMEAVAGTWLGTVSSDWNTAANWSAGVIPTSDIDVTIPPGTPYACILEGGVTANAEDLTIQAGAVLTQNSTSYLYVHGNFDSDAGQFIMTGSGSYLYFAGSTNTWWDDDNENDTYTQVRVFKDLSTAQLTMSQNMTCSGTFEVREGVFVIAGTWTLTITNTSVTAFQVEAGGKLVLTDETIDCAGGVVFYSDSQADVSGGTIRCGDDFTNNSNATYDIQFTGGTVIMKGSGSTFINDLDGGTLAFFNLMVDKPSGTCYIKSANLTVNGTLTINSGAISCNNDPAPTAVYNITVGGSWDNNVGASGFEESTGTVTFVGSTLQYCYNETFNNLELNKSGSILRISSTIVNCAHYDFTAGGLQVLSGGAFTALDLLDNGIFGNYYLYDGGTIDLYNTDGFIDLHGFLYIYGGNFNVWGGSGIDSYWPYMDNAGITMSGGVLDFKDYGVYVSNTLSYTLTENITGGTIRTSGNFRSDRTDFNPTGGTIEFYGPYDCAFRAISGSNVHHVVVNKGAYDTPSDGMPKPVLDRETGQTSYAPLLYTVVVSGITDINGNVTIQNGVLSAGAQTLYVAGNWNNTAGTTAFLEGTSTVEFDGADAADILSAETFYNLTLNKTFAGYECLEVMENLGCGGTLHLIDGTLEVNSPANVDVNSDVTIELNACLNVNDYTGLQVSVGGNWTNLNTSRSITEGFWYGTSHVVFDGTTDQLLSTTATEEMFYDLTVTKSAGEFKPNDNILCYGDANVVSGIWEDNAVGLHHTMYGDFGVQTAGGFYTATPHNMVEFAGTDPAQITYLGTGGSFYNLLINKNTGVSVTLASNARSWYDGAVTVNQGVFNLNGHEFLLTGNLAVNTNGLLQLPAASILTMTDSRNININSGGRIELAGSPVSKANVRANVTTARYGFSVNTGGTIAAEHTIFRQVNASGVYVAAGATVDATHSFLNCTFQDGAAGGTLLQINNTQTLTVRNANFPTNTWGGASNVTKTVNSGRVYFVDYTGSFSGESFDNDAFNRLDWVSPMTATATAVPSSICAGSSTQLNVNRSGGLPPFTYLWSPATGLSDPGIINPLATPGATTTYTVTVTDYLGTTATGSVTVTVNPNLTVGVSIAASANPSAPGDFVSFTATPFNGGSSPAYQWKVNGINAGSGLPTYSYVPSNGDDVTCVLTSNYACPVGNPATSNTVTMIVVPVNTTVTGNVPAPLSLCFDASNTVTVAGGGSTFTVQPGASVNLIAGQRIRILEGASVLSGAYLHGWITTTHSYCGSLPPAMVATVTAAGDPAGEALEPAGTRDGFLLYPNPTTGQFTLMARDPGFDRKASVEIYGIRGERCGTSEFRGTRTLPLDLRGAAPGLYFVKVASGGTTEILKLVLTK